MVWDNKRPADALANLISPRLVNNTGVRPDWNRA
jgi:hypothetical protein